MVRESMESLRGKLSWKFETRKHDEDSVTVSCDPILKKHMVFSPRGRRVTELELLRASCHASLAEEVSPLFSAIVAESGDMLPEKVFKGQIWPALCVSRIWFADGRMAEVCPPAARDEVLRRFKELEERYPGGEVEGSIDSMLLVALTVAEAEVFCGNHKKVFGRLRALVGMFRRIGAGQPTLRKLQTLNNGLLSAYCPFRVEPRYQDDLGMDIWQVE